MQEKHTIEKQLSAACVGKRNIIRELRPILKPTSTTSVPPFWMRDVRYSVSSLVKEHAGFTYIRRGNYNKMLQRRVHKLIQQNLVIVLTCDRRGSIVTPAWPPTTGTLTSRGSSPITSALKYNFGNDKWLRNSKDN